MNEHIERRTRTQVLCRGVVTNVVPARTLASCFLRCCERRSFTANFLNQGGALVHVYLDGTVLVSHGGTEMGQGVHTKVCQVVANEFGIDVKKVRGFVALGCMLTYMALYASEFRVNR